MGTKEGRMSSNGYTESYRITRGGYRVERAMGTRREASARFACVECAEPVEAPACHCRGHAVEFAGYLGATTRELRGASSFTSRGMSPPRRQRSVRHE